MRLRLVSDVPLGVFLSGGIDSSSVVAMMAELMPPARIKTFAIGFEEKSFDESGHARRVADFFGTDHREQILNSQTLLEILPQVAAFLDEPLADASIIPTYLLSKFTRQHVTVALGGDGGDELFAGYPTFQAHRLAGFYKAPRALHERVIRPLAEMLPVSAENFSFDFKVKRFLRGAGCRARNSGSNMAGIFHPGRTARPAPGNGAPGTLTTTRIFAEAESHCACPKQHGAADLSLLQVLSAGRHPHQGGSRQHGLFPGGARAVPGLHLRRIRQFDSLPSQAQGLTAKYILKKAMRNKLPPEILARRKKGFGIPVAKWFRNDLRSLMLDTLSESRIRAQGLFNPAEVARLVDEHLRGSKDHRKQLWTLFMFELWFEQYMAGC